MPSSFASLDTGFPNLNKYGSTEQKLQAIESYLVQLLEQLRYTLNNLSQDNFNTKEVAGWLGQVVTEPIQVAIQDAEDEMRTEITAAADGVKIDVHKEYATEWTGNTQYKVNDVVKVTTSSTLNFYKCTADHTSSAGSPPPNANWSSLQATDVLHSRFDMNSGEIRSEVSRATGIEGGLSNSISAVDQKADSIQLQVTGTSAPEWVTNHHYDKDDVVKVTTAATSSTPQSIRYYKAKVNHTSSNANQPPSSAWEVTVAPNVNSMIDLNLNGLTLSYDNNNIGSTEHNGSYIQIMKDGTFIGGGKVFIKDLDASTIKTGTLDAGNIILKNSFDVKTLTPDNNVIDCGTLGGGYTSTGGGYEGSIYFESESGHNKSYSSIGNDSARLMSDITDFDNHRWNYAEVDTRIKPIAPYSAVVELTAMKYDWDNSRSDMVEVEVGSGEITIKKTKDGTTKTYHLLDLLDQI